MTKRTEIFHKLKANLWVLLLVCFALFLCSGLAEAADTPCNKERMDKIYKSGCYACDIVTALIGSFVTACQYLYDVSKDAGTKILFIGVMLWLAFYILQQLVSLKNLEPAAMVNELLIMAFKILGAYLVINAGIDFFINFALVPFMNFGADFGLAMVNAVSGISGLDLNNISVNSAYTFEDKNLGHFLNQLQKYVAAVDYTVSTHLEIGHMLTCYASGAGAWNWVVATIINFWMWLSGAFIWFCGFMMTLSVTYYLVDISFKLGFAIIALPITVGLWPFNVTKGKLTACFSIILKSAGILIFLAMTVACGLALVSSALEFGQETATVAENGAQLSGSDRVMQAIEDGDGEYIGEQFSFWSFRWIIILFAYLYAIKLIGSTMSDYVDKFFPDQIFGSASPMHRKLTQVTDMAKSAAMKPVKVAGKIAKHQTGKLVGKGLNFIANKFKGKEGGGLMDRLERANKSFEKLRSGQFNQEEEKKPTQAQSAMAMTSLDADKDKKNMERQEKGSSGGSGAGAAMEQSGQAIKEAGQQLEAAANNIDQSLATADQTQKAANQAIQSAAHAGTAATFGIGAAVTETTAAASATASTASSAAITAGRAAAKAMKVAGKVMKKTGNVMKKTGKMIKKAEKAVKKAKKALNMGKKDGSGGNIIDNIMNQVSQSAGVTSDGQGGQDGMMDKAFDQTTGADKKK